MNAAIQLNCIFLLCGSKLHSNQTEINPIKPLGLKSIEICPQLDLTFENRRPRKSDELLCISVRHNVQLINVSGIEPIKRDLSWFAGLKRKTNLCLLRSKGHLNIEKPWAKIRCLSSAHLPSLLIGFTYPDTGRIMRIYMKFR